VDAATLQPVPGKDGILRSQNDLYMEGSEVFAFTLKRVPNMIKQVLSMASWDMNTMDGLVPHQANQFMLDHLAKRMKVPSDKLMLSIGEYGNTSSASIPLTLSHSLRERLSAGSMNLVMAGFGVGWSWGALAVSCGPMVMSEIVCSEVPVTAGV
jgi:3-oxoacyl-[acyl-carrier-protein] synthase-3